MIKREIDWEAVLYCVGYLMLFFVVGALGALAARAVL